MRVIVQKLDRYGEAPIETGVASITGSTSFKSNKGVNLELLKKCLNRALKINEQEELDYITGECVVMSKDGNTVHITMEETDFVFTNVDPFIAGE